MESSEHPTHPHPLALGRADQEGFDRIAPHFGLRLAYPQPVSEPSPPLPLPTREGVSDRSPADIAAPSEASLTLRINSWSGPRNVSTALMRSFSQRSDTLVADEPLYGHYLAVSGAPHPGRDELIQTLETDARVVTDRLILGPCSESVLFMKQMVHHLTPDVDLSFLDRCVNVMLIRDPAEVIASLVNQLPEPSLRDVGLERQVELFRDLTSRGQTPPVIDARLLLLDPRGVLGDLCDRLGLPWQEAMLSWPPGPLPEDGPWAKYWYDSVERSTGFEPYRPSAREVPPHCRALVEECRPLYEELFTHAIGAGETL